MVQGQFDEEEEGGGGEGLHRASTTTKEEDLHATRQVYLVTYSQANLQRFPTRKSFAEGVLAAFRNTGAPAIQWVCCREAHESRGHHYHMAVKLERCRRWRAAKYYLQDKYDVSVHFSNVHHDYYSAWRYVTKEDEYVLESDGHPYFWNSRPPRTSRACQSNVQRTNDRVDSHANDERESTENEANQNRQRNSRKRKRMSAFDLSEIVLQKGITSRTELLALAQEQKDEGKTDIAEFVFNRGPKVVTEVIDTTWEMKKAKESLERAKKTRLQLLREAMNSECANNCNGVWKECAYQVLDRNGIDRISFANAVKELLDKGRGKYRNVMIVGPANCGKTFILNPLNMIFTTFCNPATATFAWVGAENSECIFLNDFRWSPQIIAWHDLLLLLEGQTVHLPAPKSHFTKDITFDRDTPIFCTGKRTMVYIKNGVIDERECGMMDVRWKVFHFNHQIPEHEQRTINVCSKCFASLILSPE